VSGPATSPEYLPIWVAAADGHFTRQGLQVTVRPTRSEVGAAEALAQSQVNLAATSLEALLRFGAREGQSPRVLLGLTAAPPVALVVSTSHAGRVRNLGDLSGLRVGISANHPRCEEADRGDRIGRRRRSVGWSCCRQRRAQSRLRGQARGKDDRRRRPPGPVEGRRREAQHRRSDRAQGPPGVGPQPVA
jgi:hypothetical protein